MPLLSFVARRFFTGTVARTATNSLTRRFKLSPAVASITLIVMTELLARAVEKPGLFSKRR